jgi:hypothetical protein
MIMFFIMMFVNTKPKRLREPLTAMVMRMDALYSTANIVMNMSFSIMDAIADYAPVAVKGMLMDGLKAFQKACSLFLIGISSLASPLCFGASFGINPDGRIIWIVLEPVLIIICLKC